MSGWRGVDLDGTLAEYHHGDLRTHGWTYIGPPVPAMVERVKQWLAQGDEIRIFTARVSEEHPGELAKIREAIENWCEEHIGQKLIVTNVKDYSMFELWDDRAVQVIPNTGENAAEAAYDRGYENAIMGEGY